MLWVPLIWPVTFYSNPVQHTVSYFEGSKHKWLPLLFAELRTFHFQLKVERDEMTTNYQDEDS